MNPSWDDTEEIKQPQAAAPTWDETSEVNENPKSVGGFAANAVSDAGEIVGGMASLAGNMATHPIDTTVQTVKGIPTAVKELAKAWGVPEAAHGRFMDAIKKIGDSVYQKPVSRALDVASVAIPALKGAGLLKGVEGAEMANQAGKLGKAAELSADSRWAKSIGGTLKDSRELGAEEFRRLGRKARDTGIVTPLNSTESMADNLSAVKGPTGKGLGDLRAEGDAIGAAPQMDQVMDSIKKEMGPQYKKGIRQPESGQFNNALDEVEKLGPTPKTSEISDKVTEMNKFSKRPGMHTQPTEATTEVANRVARANDESLVQALGSEKGQNYSKLLNEYGDQSKIDQMLTNKADFEAGGSRNSITNNISNRLLHKFGYQLSAAGMDKIAGFLKTNPEKFGRYAKVLNGAMTAGPAALATTVDLLAQNDPEFAKQMEGLK